MIKRDKFINTFLYFIDAAKHPTLGKVKLAKLLFFADAIAYDQLGRTITGKQYVKMMFGPVPCNYNEDISSMETEGLITKKSRTTIKGDQEYYVPHKKANLKKFIKTERKIIKEVVRIFGEKVTSSIVKFSHRILPWDIIDRGEIISFELFGLDCEEAKKLKLRKDKLTTTDLIVNTPKLMASIRKGKQDVKKQKVKAHEWTS
jgi:uncharacterized phage-associated protein